MKTKHCYLIVFSLVLVLAFTGSCTRKAVEAPSPVGPSTYAVILDAHASPNMIIAGKSRDTINVTVNVTNFQGVPLANETILFEIFDPDTGQVTNIGYFEDKRSVVTRVTNSSGVAGVLYFGPISEELIDSFPGTDPTQTPIPDPPAKVYIRASLAWEGNQFIYDYAPVEIITDYNTLEFRLRADPNVLWIKGASQESTLTATLKTIQGAPISGRKLFFKIESGKGEFKNGLRTAFGTTDANGEAKIVYASPNRNQISSDRLEVKFSVHLETEDPNWAHAETSVWLFRGN